MRGLGTRAAARCPLMVAPQPSAGGAGASVDSSAGASAATGQSPSSAIFAVAWSTDHGRSTSGCSLSPVAGAFDPSDASANAVSRTKSAPTSSC